MNPVKIVIGFVPFLLLTVVGHWLPIGWAAAIALAAAVVVIAITARGGLKMLPVAQAVILVGFALLGFLAGASVSAFLGVYGRGLASLVLGLFIVLTATSTPFTAQFAREAVPPAEWGNPLFVEVNRKLSLAWGAVVLVLGACHVLGAFLDAQHVHPVLALLVDWVVPILAFVRVISYTRRIAAQHSSPSVRPSSHG
jgi:hypothetical protein